MARLGAVVGNARVPAHWEQGHLQDVSHSLEMLARLLALSFKWFGITVWKVATDLGTRDFERPRAEVSHSLTERVMKRAALKPAQGGSDQTLPHLLCPGDLCCPAPYKHMQGSRGPCICS